jgi:hypothetical protein
VLLEIRIVCVGVRSPLALRGGGIPLIAKDGMNGAAALELAGKW